MGDDIDRVGDDEDDAVRGVALKVGHEVADDVVVGVQEVIAGLGFAHDGAHGDHDDVAAGDVGDVAGAEVGVAGVVEGGGVEEVEDLAFSLGAGAVDGHDLVYLGHHHQGADDFGADRTHADNGDFHAAVLARLVA